MNPDLLRIVCDPATHDALELRSEPGQGPGPAEFLLNPKTDRRFPIRHGIPVFLQPGEVTGSNLRYQTLYDRLAPVYDLTTGLGARLRGMAVEDRLREYLDELEVTAESLVLEVSVGTGRNLQYLPRSAKFVGLDISWGMLRRCQRNGANWNLDLTVCMAAAERLPFRDQVFDVVFSFGGFNFFNDRAEAVREMIRVARPGTKLLVGDETEAAARNYERLPLVGGFYGRRLEPIAPPLDLLPPGMEQVRVKEIAGGDLYCLTFRKP